MQRVRQGAEGPPEHRPGHRAGVRQEADPHAGDGAAEPDLLQGRALPQPHPPFRPPLPRGAGPRAHPGPCYLRPWPRCGASHPGGYPPGHAAPPPELRAGPAQGARNPRLERGQGPGGLPLRAHLPGPGSGGGSPNGRRSFNPSPGDSSKEDQAQRPPPLQPRAEHRQYVRRPGGREGGHQPAQAD